MPPLEQNPPSATVPVASSKAPVLAAHEVTKAFGPVKVLQDVTLDFFGGEIHAIVGENGAGKSTLMKILAGLLEPTSGEVRFRGETVETGDLRRMEERGVRFIHQELNLAEDLRVVENLFLGEEPRRGLFLDEARMRAQGREVLRRVGAEVDLDARVSDLRISEKQLVEIAKAISQQATALILDEPTAMLTQPEADRLFEIIESFAAEGVAILYISHRLEEVKRLATRISVLRDGRLVATRPANELAPNEIVRLMVGRSLQDFFPEKKISARDQRVLEVRNLSVPGYVNDASFELKKGEILGFAGLIGAGRSELFEGLMGLRKTSSGTVLRDGRPVGFTDYPQAIARLRAAYLPEDRKGKGLVVSFDAPTNYSLLGLDRFGTWFVDRRKERASFRKAVDHFQIKVSDYAMPVAQLSGGNQQKVVLAKILTIDPEIIIFDEPTRGIDVGTKAQIYRWIGNMAAEGRSCIVISSELLEIVGLCHRVIVMRSSRIVASLEGDAISEDQIMLYATGVRPAEPFLTS
jgi:ribose transport system ATP-binding protein